MLVLINIGICKRLQKHKNPYIAIEMDDSYRKISAKQIFFKLTTYVLFKSLINLYRIYEITYKL